MLFLPYPGTSAESFNFSWQQSLRFLTIQKEAALANNYSRPKSNKYFMGQASLLQPCFYKTAGHVYSIPSEVVTFKEWMHWPTGSWGRC